MAVPARYHAFPHDHDLRAITSSPAPDNDATTASAFLVADPATTVCGANTVLISDLLTCSGDNHGRGSCLGKRKRARVTMDLQGHQPPAGDVQSRALCSASASTSGRRPASSAAPVSQGILSHLYRHGVEIDLLLRVETERLRAGLQDARRRHARAVLSAVESGAARRLRAAEAELERALARNAELDERLRQTEAEGQAWQDIARSHEGVAAGLRATIDSLMQSPCAGAAGAEGGDAEDAQSCCFELEKEQEQEQERGAEASGWRRARACCCCRWCGAAEACVLLLPCRHLCLCHRCEAGVGACPVCAATKNASLHVLLS